MENLELNLPSYSLYQSVANISLLENVCFCCLARDKVMVNLTNCKHSDFLKEYFTLDYPRILVCSNCHYMLQKITSFRQKVQESHEMLKHREFQATNKLYFLQNSDITVTSTLEDFEVVKEELLNTENAEFDLKEKSANQNSSFQMDTDVKIEHDDSDFENDLPLSQIKKRKGARKKLASVDKKYEGKIGLLVMSKNDLMLEREKESMKDSYLKLPFKCESCIRGFDSENTLKSHNEKQHEKQGGFRCDICNSVLSTESSYKEHARRHLTRYVCMICGKRTKDVYSVSRHYNQVHGAGDCISMQFTCAQCNYNTDSYRAYSYHREKHKLKQSCTLCGSSFVTSTGLRKHMDTVHKQSTRLYECPSCDKTYRCKSGLFNHCASHAHGGTPAQPAYCAPCRKHFVTKTSLAFHLKNHSSHVTEDSKKFVCNECGAKFLRKQSLQSHIDWEHLKTAQYQCHTCSKVFKSATTLKSHVKYVHEKKRPPRNKVCDYCGRAFFSTAVLVSHIRTHTGARPLRCSHCSATFAHPAALYTHNKLIHKQAETIKTT